MGGKTDIAKGRLEEAAGVLIGNDMMGNENSHAKAGRRPKQ